MSVQGNIQPIQKDDVKAYHQVLRASWLATYVNSALGITEQIIEEFTSRFDTPERIAKFEAAVEEGKMKEIYTIKHKGGVVGALHLVINDTTGKIQVLYLNPEFKGRGYGGQLMKFALNRFKDLNLQTVQLEVADFNQNAIDFYRKYGFEVTGQNGKDFALSDDFIMKTLIMEKSL